MAERKYKKYFSELNVNELAFHLSQKGKSMNVMHYDHNDNEEAPHFMEANLRYGSGAVSGDGGIVQFPRSSYYRGQTRSLPHKHPFQETFCWMGLDPDHPDDLGGTVEFWIGEGNKAEKYIITKPSSLVLPENIVHLPMYISEVRKPFLSFGIMDSPLWVGLYTEKFPPAFRSVAEGVLEQIAFKPGNVTNKGKYEKYFNVTSVKDLVVPPSHKGRATPIMRCDRSCHEEALHYIQCNLLYGSGIGFGTGESEQSPPLPNKHPFYETFCFIGLDPDHLDDLGGTVEFWIGEGNEAEKYIITKPTNVLVPKNTLHLPVYIKEVHRPFVMITVLDLPLWAGHLIEKFPSGFKNVIKNK